MFFLLRSGKDPSRLEKDLLDGFRTNVVGGIHLTNLSLPLILKGNVKKVVSISTGHADPDISTEYNVYECSPYAISKAGANMAMARFHAEYAKDGVLFISISPGVVDVGRTNNRKVPYSFKIVVHESSNSDHSV